jgi:GTP-binding protein Era
MKSGFVAIIGRPNVGKSTMLNSILKYEVSIVSDKPQTTRDKIKGIYNDRNSQIVFLDTPGIHKPEYKFGENLNSKSYSSIKDADVVIFLSPVNDEIAKGDNKIIDLLKNIENKIAIMTKLDLEPSDDLKRKKAEELKTLGFKVVLGISNKYPTSILNLVNEIKTMLPEHELYYDKEEITDKSMRFIAKEVIRESAINLLKEELPHSLAVVIDGYKSKTSKTEIDATLYVARDSQKVILIGRNGSLINKIKNDSRKKISRMVGQNVNLTCHIKVLKKWYKNEKFIKKLGY